MSKTLVKIPYPHSATSPYGIITITTLISSKINNELNVGDIVEDIWKAIRIKILREVRTHLISLREGVSLRP